jgi:hypothetical protein
VNVLPYRRLALVIAVAVVAAAVAPAAHACQSCFGAEDSPLIDGARVGAFALIGVTVAVQIAFVAFFLYLRRRARIVAAMEASSPWAEAPHTSR